MNVFNTALAVLRPFLLLGFIVLGILTHTLTAQPTYNWGIGIGSDEGDIVEALATDTSGNIFITGTISKTTDFDPGPGTAYITPVSSYQQAFLAKYASDGSYLWAVTFGGTVPTQDISDAVDLLVLNDGSVLLTGTFEGTIDFDPRQGFELRSAAGEAMYLAKISSGGQLIWVNTSMDQSGTEIQARSICVDRTGNIYGTGIFRGTTDLGFGASGNTLNATHFSIYLFKCSSAGNHIWSFLIPGSSTSYPQSSDLLIDNYGAVYCTGTIKGMADFDPDTGTSILNGGGGHGLFVAKYDTVGTYDWGWTITGNTSRFYTPQLAFDTVSNFYVAGGYNRTSDFDPGPGQDLRPTGPTDDIFLAKYDPTGNYIWAINIGGYYTQTDNNTGATGLMTDVDGNPIISGHYDATLDFDPGMDTIQLQSVNTNSDIFLAKYDGNGNYLWARSMGGTGTDKGHRIAWDMDGSLIMTGTFENTTDLDPSGNTQTVQSNGEEDIFLAKYIMPCTGVPYYVTEGFCPGDVYMLGTQAITTPGSYSATLQNQHGCDSTVHLTLSHYPTYTTSDTMIMCVGDTLQFGTQTLTQSGVYTENLSSQDGCDSVVTLSLNLIQLDTTISVIGSHTLQANEPNANYKWMDCDQGHLIPGAGNRTFTPGVNGNYAVIVSKGNCSDTSACIAVTNVGMEDEPSHLQISIYPNPAREQVHLSFYLPEAMDATIRLYDFQGRAVFTKALRHVTGHQAVAVPTGHLPAGMYQVLLRTEHGSVVRKVMVQR